MSDAESTQAGPSVQGSPATTERALYKWTGHSTRLAAEADMRVNLKRAPWFVPLFVCATLTLSAQTPRLLDKDTFMEMEAVGNPAISPDGSRVVFAREWIDQIKDQRRSNLWVARTDGSRVRELTAGAWRDSAPGWAPDGARIAFLSDRDGTTQLHVVFADTGEMAQLTHVQRAPAGLRWSPDGTRIAFTSTIPDEDPILRVELPKKPRGAEWAKGATIVDRLSWQRDGVGPVEKGYTHVFIVDATLGGTPRQLTTGKFNHGDPDWSADGNTLYVSGTRKPDAEYLRNDSEIYAIDVASGSIKPLTDRKGPDTNPTLSPDGKWIAYTGYDDRNETSTLSSLYLMDRDGGAKRLWQGRLSESPANLAWAHDGSGVYFTTGEKGSTSVYFAALAGELRKLTDGVQELSGLSIADTGQAAAVRSTPTRRGYLVTFP